MGMVLADIETTIAWGFFGAAGALLVVSTSPTALTVFSVDASGVLSSTGAFSPGAFLLVVALLRFMLVRRAAAWLSRVSLFLKVKHESEASFYTRNHDVGKFIFVEIHQTMIIKHE